MNLDDYFIPLTPTPGVIDIESLEPVYTYTEIPPTFTPTEPPSTSTPHIIYVTEAYEVLEEGEWVIECTAPEGCFIREEPTFRGEGEAVPEGTVLVAIARYMCVGHEFCEEDVPIWWYLSDGRWVSGLVWKEV